MNITIVPGEFRRPSSGLVYEAYIPGEGVPLIGRPAWQSQGGVGKRHPDRALPAVLHVAVPAGPGVLKSIRVVGALALHASPGDEMAGTRGATIRLLDGDSSIAQYELVQGRHYSDASDLAHVYRLNGDGTSVETVGQAKFEGRMVRIDALTLEAPAGSRPSALEFRDLGTPASFAISEVLFEQEEPLVCPFRGVGGRVALGEIGSVLRLRDRARYRTALDQLMAGVERCGPDLDEGRGLALTFLSAVSSAMFEMGAPRSMHRMLLEAAREFETLDSARAIGERAVEIATNATATIIPKSATSGDALVDRSLALIERHYAKDLSDARIAADLGLSTSHFRYLFRLTTRQPFHKYLLSIRLEKARELLLQSSMPVSDISESVGFTSPAHFSRAFVKRFGTPPSALRQARRSDRA